MQKIDYRRVLPFIVAVVVYTLFVVFYFAPQLRGDVLVMGDVQQYRGMTQEIIETRETTGDDPQWTGSMFGGMPAYLINVEYPSQIIKRAASVVTNLISTPAAFILFAMLSMWLMLVMMGVNGYVAIVGGAMYGLSTYFMLIIEAGHLTKMWALVYAPMMMGAIYVTLRRGVVWGALLTALFTSLEVGANHPQITYYFLMAAAALWISELYFSFKEGALLRFAKRTAFVALAALFGVLSNLSPLWYTAEHTPDTMRGGSELAVSSGGDGDGLALEYATAWSYGRSESFNMLIPDFMGRHSAHPFSMDGDVAGALRKYGMAEASQQLPAYWGTQPFTSGPTYLGAVVLFLACVGFGLSKGRERWWILGISIVMLMLAWGSNMMWFTQLMFDILPGYNKFRTVSMTLVVVQWTAPLLASFALSRLWSGEWEQGEALKVVGISAILTAGVAFIFALFGGVFFGFDYAGGYEMLLNVGLPDQMSKEVARAMATERSYIMAADAWRTVMYIAISGGAVVAFLLGRVSRVVMLAVVGLTAIVDLSLVDMRFLSHDDFTAPRVAKIVASDADREIMADEGESGEREYRVLNLTKSPFNDASTSYFHRSIGGYHGAKLARYQDLIDRYLSRQDSAVLDMLNTRYLITADGVERRESALGAAWFVESAIEAKSASEAIGLLDRVPLYKTAIVEKSVDGFSDGVIVMEEYQPHYQRYRYFADDKALAVFSEIYYDKGWSAYIDNEEVPYMRANYILRALELPAGEHKVEWRFRAPRWSLIEGVTLMASLAIILSILGYLIFKLNETKSEVKA